MVNINKTKLFVSLIIILVIGSMTASAWNANPTYNPFEIIWNAINDLFHLHDQCEARVTALEAQIADLQGHPWVENCTNGIDDNYNNLTDCADSVCDGLSCNSQMGICYEGSCCTPICDGLECGSDGCGGSCGICDSGYICNAGTCEVDCDDQDGDGYGTGSGCLGMDCDDYSSSINPGAEELCDGLDNNCNGYVDEENATDCSIYYKDMDHDLFGVSSDSKCLCSPSGDYSTIQNLDCDDSNSDVNPNAKELCNGFDDDCDGDIDEGTCGPVDHGMSMCMGSSGCAISSCDSGWEDDDGDVSNGCETQTHG